MRRVIEPLSRMGARIPAGRRSGAADHHRRRAAADRLHAPRPERPGEERHAAGRSADGWHDDGPGDRRDTRSYGAWRCARSAPRSAASRAGSSLDGNQRLRAIEATRARRFVVGDVLGGRRRGAARIPTRVPDVGLNATRTALFDVLAPGGRARGRVEADRVEHGEPRGTVRVRARQRSSRSCSGPTRCPASSTNCRRSPRMATHGGDLHVTGAAELRVKESDRISALAAGLRALGGDIDEFAGRLSRPRRPPADGWHRRRRAATTASRWRSPSPRSAPSGRPSSRAPTPLPSPIPDSSTRWRR